VRAEFPIAQERIYLNHAGIGPIPSVTKRAVQEGASTLADFHDMGKLFHDLFPAARQNAARLINALPDEIAFVQNTAEGILSPTRAYSLTNLTNYRWYTLNPTRAFTLTGLTNDIWYTQRDAWEHVVPHGYSARNAH
jgi:selenocysteine lyase/cysteine desulfurase